MPKDPIMLLSFINTMLRDKYPSLSELAASEGADENEIIEKLKAAGYTYDKDKNHFVALG